MESEQEIEICELSENADLPISISSDSVSILYSETLSSLSDSRDYDQSLSDENSSEADFSNDDKPEDTTVPKEDTIVPDAEASKEMGLEEEFSTVSNCSWHSQPMESKKELDPKFDRLFFERLQRKEVSREDREEYFSHFGLDLTYSTDDSRDECTIEHGKNRNISSLIENQNVGVAGNKVAKVFMEKLSPGIIDAYTNKPRVLLEKLPSPLLDAYVNKPKVDVQKLGKDIVHAYLSNPKVYLKRISQDIPQSPSSQMEDPYLNPTPSTSSKGCYQAVDAQKEDNGSGSRCASLLKRNLEKSVNDTETHESKDGMKQKLYKEK